MILLKSQSWRPHLRFSDPSVKTPRLPPPHQIMFYVYIIKSRKDGENYIGYTNDLRRRLKQHELGKTLSTRFRRPFQLIYYEAYSAIEDAIHREANLKLRNRAFIQLKKRIKSSLLA